MVSGYVRRNLLLAQKPTKCVRSVPYVWSVTAPPGHGTDGVWTQFLHVDVRVDYHTMVYGSPELFLHDISG